MPPVERSALYVKLLQKSRVRRKEVNGLVALIPRVCSYRYVLYDSSSLRSYCESRTLRVWYKEGGGITDTSRHTWVFVWWWMPDDSTSSWISISAYTRHVKTSRSVHTGYIYLGGESRHTRLSPWDRVFFSQNSLLCLQASCDIWRVPALPVQGMGSKRVRYDVSKTSIFSYFVVSNVSTRYSTLFSIICTHTQGATTAVPRWENESFFRRNNPPSEVTSLHRPEGKNIIVHY